MLQFCHDVPALFEYGVSSASDRSPSKPPASKRRGKGGKRKRKAVVAPTKLAEELMEMQREVIRLQKEIIQLKDELHAADKAPSPPP